MKESVREISNNIDKAVELIRDLRVENEKLKRKNLLLADQIRAVDSENKISARAMKDFEKMKLERIRIKDKVGVMLNTLRDVK